MDKVLDMGIDAWKCDGTDPMTILLRPWPYSPHKKRFIKPSAYSHLYYGTFYNYTKERNPNALIMARPVDSFHEIGYLAYAPKYVMFSGWVGDQNANSGGLGQALSNVMHSAWKGYLNFGFDIGGYRGNSNKVSKNVFIRWAQVGSMVPFMENGGNGLHEPWAFDQ
jgi:alpha-glucosidase (family GH31 glycosyl hydrolase)